MWTDEQNEAIKSEGENIIVSASAGSGKTAVLSERVLRKLRSGVNIDELLILTFTKAAAAEMKERIRKKISLDKNLSSQLAKIDAAYITTFDAFALAMVKKYNYVLNVSKNMEIGEASIFEIEKRHRLEAIFEEMYRVQDSDFLKLIGDFCEKDDQEIVDYILNIDSKLDLLYQKESFLNNYEDQFFNDDFITQKINEYEELLHKKITNIYKLVNMLNEYVDNDYFEKLNDTLGELFIAESYEQIKSNIKTLPSLPKNSEEEAKALKEELSEELKSLSSLCTYETRLDLKNSIYETRPYIKALIKIIKQLDGAMMTFKNYHNLYEFSDIAKMAIRILEENVEIREELKNSLNEILIDEYQDTNDLQELFISYISHDNVYMVGDIKQSIYRFRNANPNLFKNKYENYSKKVGGKKIDLNKNFRSREEVLANINLIFNLVMNNDLGGADYKESHQMVFGNNTYQEEGFLNQDSNLDILNYFYPQNIEFKKEEVEAFIIAQDIKKKIANKYQVFDKDKKIVRDIQYEDIVILMDRSTSFELYKKIFEYLKIPLIVYKDEDIKSSGDIALFKNILALILKTDFSDYKYAFVSVARSYLFNMDDDLIFNYVQDNKYQDSEIMQIVKMIDGKNMTIKEIVLAIIEKFNFYEKIITVGQVDNHLAVLDYLINLADSLTKLGYTLEDFKNYLDELLDKDYQINYSLNKKNQGVKIMTIHKSKGLEYHLCYYSGLYRKFNISDLSDKFLYDNDYGIITPIIDEGIRPIFYKELLKNKYLREEISERIRLFYVALTRAKEKMIMVVPFNIVENRKMSTKLENNYTSFLDILYAIKNNLGKYLKNVDLNSLDLTKDYNLIRENNYAEKIDKTDKKLEVVPYEAEITLENSAVKHFSKTINYLETKEETEMLELGVKMHEILANLDLQHPILEGLNNFEKQKVKAFLNTNILENVLNVYQELEFYYEDEGISYHGIMDLVLEYALEFKIIDYKLNNIQDEGYLQQLKGYKKYLARMTDKKIKVYLYSIVTEELLELKV